MNQNDDKTCGHCARFRETDGWCRKKGRYVNALSVEQCFLPVDEQPQTQEPGPKPHMKVCKDCGRELPLDEFPRHPKSRDGHAPMCKECYSAKMKEAQKKDALMAAFPEVDFLWWVKFGRWTFRSDISVFSTLASGAKWEHRYTSSELAPLFKYCRHLKALDLGHNDLRDLSLLGTLPELQVLILVDNPWLVDISPLAGLSQLRYLELFCCYKIVDYGSLSSLTLLEDLNVCHEGMLKDPAIFDGLTNLKVCWMRGVGFTWAQKQAFLAAHPEACVEFDVYEDPQSSTDGGWRATEENVMIRTAFYNYLLVESFDYDEGLVFLPDSEPVWLLPTMGS